MYLSCFCKPLTTTCEPLVRSLQIRTLLPNFEHEILLACVSFSTHAQLAALGTDSREYHDGKMLQRQKERDSTCFCQTTSLVGGCNLIEACLLTRRKSATLWFRSLLFENKGRLKISTLHNRSQPNNAKVKALQSNYCQKRSVHTCFRCAVCAAVHGAGALVFAVPSIYA